jgi:hypothetical protein
VRAEARDPSDLDACRLSPDRRSLVDSPINRLSKRSAREDLRLPNCHWLVGAYVTRICASPRQLDTRLAFASLRRRSCRGTTALALVGHVWDTRPGGPRANKCERPAYAGLRWSVPGSNRRPPACKTVSGVWTKGHCPSRKRLKAPANQAICRPRVSYRFIPTKPRPDPIAGGPRRGPKNCPRGVKVE